MPEGDAGKQQRTRIVIVGGVAGGASTAARARRLDERASIVVFERGREASFANCGLPYYIGGEIADRTWTYGELDSTPIAGLICRAALW